MEARWSLQALALALPVLILIQFVLAQQLPISATERIAMMELRSSLGLRGRDWPIKKEPCRWVGVRCRSGRVIEINVSGLRRTRASRENPSFSIDSLSNITNLVSLNTSGFSLHGQIPRWLGSRLPFLQVLDLRSSSVTGCIPSSLGNLSRLAALYLSGNNFTGTIPKELGKLKQLTILDLSGNSLTGSLPLQLTGLRSLRKLILRENGISGSISNGFFHNLTLLETADLSLNKLDGALPSEFSSARNLRLLDLSGNNFTGSFPKFSFNIDADDVTLNISNNLMYGNLNSTFGGFSSIDLSGNYFEGDNEKLHESVRNVTLDQNCLQAATKQRKAEDCNFFYEQRGLSFDNFGGSQFTHPSRDSKSRGRWIYILVGVLCGLAFILILVLVLVVLILSKRRGRIVNANAGPERYKEREDPVLFSGLGQPFLYEQLHSATDGFSEANLIKRGHSGELFRGLLEGDIHVVIKRVSSNFLKGDGQSLELELFKKASHPRLIPFLGHCLERENERLLVYKYMQNRDLASSFYMAPEPETDNLRSLDWITRLKIASGAAEFLSYLHHECNPPLVHGDVQASSILLDDKFEVRMGSLSEVRPQEDQKALTRMLGKQQTSDAGPSAFSQVCCPYDVYCFGKVLLELVTGKVGMSMSEEKLIEWLDQTLPCISRFDKELITKILDPSLIVDDDLMEEVWAMAVVARSCLNPRPSKRPAMKHVLKALENPLKVVRTESFNVAPIWTTSSRRSWNAGIFGSWRQNSSDSTAVQYQMIKDGASGSRQCRNREKVEHSSSRKGLSSDTFPEPIEIQESEKRREH